MHLSAYFAKCIHGVLSRTHVHVQTRAPLPLSVCCWLADTVACVEYAHFDDAHFCHRHRRVPELICGFNNSSDVFSVHNLPSYRASSQMLSSLSSYQYTRRAWKREAFELMMDSSFFQTDVSCVESWRAVIDNLMTHDRTTFKDLLG